MWVKMIHTNTDNRDKIGQEGKWEVPERDELKWEGKKGRWMDGKVEAGVWSKLIQGHHPGHLGIIMTVGLSQFLLVPPSKH